MYNPALKYDDKMAILKDHPEIMSFDDIEQELGVSKKLIADETFFEIEKIMNKQRKTEQYLDLSREINRKNLDIVLENKSNLFTKFDFRKIYNVSSEDLDDCIESGRLRQLRLYSRADGEKQGSSLVTLTSDFIETTLANVQKIGRASKFFEEVTECHSKPIMANVIELSKLGFGDPKVLHKLVINGYLSGDSRTVHTSEGEKYVTRVDLNNRRNEELLKRVRSKRCVELSYADNLFGLTRAELSNAFFDGLLKCYTEAVLIGDWNKVYIDLKCKQNIDALNKILFEKELLNGILPKNFSKAETSQRIKLAWYLAPNTRRIATEIANNDPEIMKIAKKKSKLQTYMYDVPVTNDLSPKRNYITYEDRIALKNFYEKVWEEAGEEEYLEALEKSSEILESIKGFGINEIENEVLRKLISSTKNKSKKDFMDLP